MGLSEYLVIAAVVLVALIVFVVARRSGGTRHAPPRTEHDHETAARVEEARAMTQVHQQNTHFGGGGMH